MLIKFLFGHECKYENNFLKSLEFQKIITNLYPKYYCEKRKEKSWANKKERGKCLSLNIMCMYIYIIFI